MLIFCSRLLIYLFGAKSYGYNFTENIHSLPKFILFIYVILRSPQTAVSNDHRFKISLLLRNHLQSLRINFRLRVLPDS
jgi:hypothetical protein